MATKKLKPDKEAITKILVADTDSESGAEVSDVEEEQQQQEKQLIQQASAQTTGRNKWQMITTLGTASRKEHNCSTFRWSSKRCEKNEAPHINKDSSPLSVLMFFTEIFHLLVE
jgi:hypothetical protein